MVYAKHRTMPTPVQLRIWRDYIETAEALRTRLTGRLQNESSLSSGDYQVLLALSEAEHHTIRSSELAAMIGWERSRLSHHLGRMEKRQLIRRIPCADAVHGIDVIATDPGLELFRAGSVPHLRAVKEIFIDALSAEQLTQVEDIAIVLRRHLGLDSEVGTRE
ncbi:MarR family winged helix-turn-helix transcriptional regulator [Arthrobacter sp. B2a2-09]|uniref:MarR family winged helix-turn-helix transcriptional regulator n=1 Tax=Arthrobacter sp. B2a2-09 TaxID=2952822 RepID=UPI0022CD5763|nr:MarR family transcriptional regulator [Arthrobacter sp. B2a2-09]MCZ9884495.1 MarR family transcriptional regulator [Arthrobacter sp. B2a2-09]